MNKATKQKRTELSRYIQQEVFPEPYVQGVIAIGSVAKGTARADSDIDAVVFLKPFDLYAVPAEFKWQPDQGTYHGIFSDVSNAIQLDFHRFDLQAWSQPAFEWPESICAELSEGWLAFDRNGDIQTLITERTSYGDDIRQKRLDEAITSLDWLLSETTTKRTWENFGPRVAHYRLHAAFEFLVQALFAYNDRWRTLKSRELSDLLKLPWLPENLDQELLLATNALDVTQERYQERVKLLQQLFKELVTQCQADGLYGGKPVNEAFIRQYEEPGRDWNMDEWNRKHNHRPKVVE